MYLGISAQKAVDELCDYLLGEDYYIVDPLNNTQCNLIIVEDIERKYRKWVRTKKSTRNKSKLTKSDIKAILKFYNYELTLKDFNSILKYCDILDVNIQDNHTMIFTIKIKNNTDIIKIKVKDVFNNMEV